MLRRPVGLALFLLFATASGPSFAAEIAQPPIVTRQQWKRTPAQTENMVKQNIPLREFIIHHTATEHRLRKPGNTNQEMRNIQAQHQGNRQRYRPGLIGRNWGDFAYHYFIDIDGKIAEGRSLAYEGDSGTHYDMSGRLLIVLQGQFNIDDPDPRQLRSLDSLVAWLAQKHGIDPGNISGHNDNTKTKETTECPGKNLEAYIPALKRKVTAALAR